MDCYYLGYEGLLFNYAQFSFPDAEFLCWCRARQCPLPQSGSRQQGSRCLHPRDLPRCHAGMVGAESRRRQAQAQCRRSPRMPTSFPGDCVWVKPFPTGLAHTSCWFYCGCGTWQSWSTLCCLLFLRFPLEHVHGVSAVPADLVGVMVRLSWW